MLIVRHKQEKRNRVINLLQENIEMKELFFAKRIKNKRK